MMKKTAWMLTALAAICLLVPPLRGRAAAAQPLTQDDVTLLLLGGSPSEKIITLVQQRGINFQMTPDLTKKFHDSGASDQLIEALQKAGETARTPTPSAAAPEPTVRATAGGQVDALSKSSQASQPQEVERKVSETLAGLASTPSAGSPEDNPTAPTFSLVALSGQKLDLENLKGKVVLLDFWATWCDPCRIEIPEFARLQNEYYEKGFRVIGVAVGDRKEAVREFYHKYNMNYPVAMVSPEVRKLYGGLYSLPTTLLIGRDGRIYAKVQGAPADLEMFEARIKSLLAAPGERQLAAGQGAGGPANSTAGSATESKTVSAPASAASPAGASAATGQPAAPAPPPKPASAATLTEPSPDQIQKIIQDFAAKEKLFKEARDNYTYHQINRVQQLGPDNEVVGTYTQEWDILYDDAGNRIERVTYAPESTLRDLMVTKEDLDAMRNIQPFVMTSDDLPEYDVKCLGHVQVDQITAYVFSIRPKEIKKGRQYFQGIIWVDDRDLQIVKSEGKQVPEMLHTKKGENLFPRFTTWREQIDGKYWFPTYTMADDTLYFSSGPIHIKEIVRYTNYKQFKAGSRILSVEAIDKSKPQGTAASPPPKP